MLNNSLTARPLSESSFYSEQFPANAALICFSHLRWDFVFQRPQHIVTRLARTLAIHFWEEPIVSDKEKTPRLDTTVCKQSGVVRIRPVLPANLTEQRTEKILKQLLNVYLARLEGAEIIRWYYTPMMLPFSAHIKAICTVYDCMDELANFRFAPANLVKLENQLLDAADVVFTGGYSLYEAKKTRHSNIHPFPSSVDRAHFEEARTCSRIPLAYQEVAHPRLGFYGVIDERMDLDLLATIADTRPDWQLILVGPVAKVAPQDLPRRDNIHYLGQADYADLPAHLAAWDIALMPFAINDSTRFISPTKTPEYLAGGRPVVSTPITDVSRHYGSLDGVFIADRTQFIQACQAALRCNETDEWIAKADAELGSLSWDNTVAAMLAEVRRSVAKKANTEKVVQTPSKKAQQRWQGNRQKAFDYLVVGAGFAGSVLAERLATQLDKRVLLIDRRPHIGGNAYDFQNEGGVLMHQYGPHIFHTNSDEIMRYLSRFTSWRPYEHRVRASVRGKNVPIPINRTTLNELYGLSLSSDEAAAAFLASRAEPTERIATSEDVVVSAVGRELYETFFKGYTRKQWGLDPSELDKSVTSRIPTRTSTDDRYFQDRHQVMPANGYTRMFENLLDDPRITIELGVDFEDVRDAAIYERLIYTGPIDEYFGYRYGPLPYRSLRFHHVTLDQEWFQEVGVVNYPNEATPYTRVSEYKHMTGQRSPRTTITFEFPTSVGDPYYPIPRPENQALYKRYEALALASPEIAFCGRLATYRYYNMDQVVGQALATYRRIAEQTARSTALVPVRAGGPLAGPALSPSSSNGLPATG